jgi:hypothetical protein
MTASVLSWPRRSLRRFLLGSGPLKRRSDRVQMAGRLALVLAVVAAPVLGVVVATLTTTSLEATATRQAADRHHGLAVLLEDAPAATPSADGYAQAGGWTVATRATWPLPDGTTREGTVPATPGASAGTTVPLWLDGEGNRTVAPLDPTAIPATALAMAVLPLLGVPVTAWTLYALLCFGLDSRRQRRWEQEWVTVEREWRHRLP